MCVCICHVCFPEQFHRIHKVGSTSTISGDIRPCKTMCMCTTPSLWRFNSAMNIYRDVCKVVSSSMAQKIPPKILKVKVNAQLIEEISKKVRVSRKKKTISIDHSSRNLLNGPRGVRWDSVGVALLPLQEVSTGPNPGWQSLLQAGQWGRCPVFL